MSRKGQAPFHRRRGGLRRDPADSGRRSSSSRGTARRPSGCRPGHRPPPRPCQADDGAAAVRRPPQRLLEPLDRRLRPPGLEQQLAIELVGALHGVRPSDRLGHPRLQLGGAVHLQESVGVFPLCEEVDGLHLEEHDLGLLAQFSRLPRRRGLAQLLDRGLDAGTVLEHRRAQAERDELVDAVETALSLHLAPALALDHVARAHRPAGQPQHLEARATADGAIGVVVSAHRVARLDDAERIVDEGERAGGLAKPAQLRPLVVQPRQAVEVAGGHRQASPGGPPHRGSHDALSVAAASSNPSDEDVRRHVQRVAGDGAMLA